MRASSRLSLGQIDGALENVKKTLVWIADDADAHDQNEGRRRKSGKNGCMAWNARDIRNVRR